MNDKTMQTKASDDEELAVWDTGSDSLPESSASATRSFDQSVVDNVPVELEAFIGSARLNVSELLALKQGSVISLNSSLNQLVELKLNGHVVALGEVVVVDDNFGVCIKEIYS